MRAPLGRRSVDVRPLQDPGVGELLGVSEEVLYSEVHVRLEDGKRIGGVDALVRIGREVWFLRPLWILSYIPGMIQLMRPAYRFIAKNRFVLFGGTCKTDL